MKLTVKTLKGSHFQIEVQPSHAVMAVKKNIEDAQGKELYPCGQQLLIYNGKVLKDETTLADNKVTEDGFLVVMLSKSKVIASVGTSSTQPSSNPPTTALRTTASPTTSATPNSTHATEASVQTHVPADSYGQVASNLVSGNNLELTIQQIMDMGGGSWDRETVSRALRAAFNNPERAVDYLYSGIPETAEVSVPEVRYPVSQVPETGAAPAGAVSRAPNTSPLNMFPQEAQSGAAAAPGSLDFLRDNPQFRALRTMVQANPHVLEPMLQELGKQNPNLLRLIRRHQAEFLQLVNESVEGSESDIHDQHEQEMPHTISVTPAEQEAIGRLEAMGFDRALVIEAFFACDRNEELAANYLLENAGDFED